MRDADECVRFARSAGYHTITLWTYDVLGSARKIHVAAGFKLAHEERESTFGHDMTSQTWDMAL